MQAQRIGVWDPQLKLLFRAQHIWGLGSAAHSNVSGTAHLQCPTGHQFDVGMCFVHGHVFCQQLLSCCVLLRTQPKLGDKRGDALASKEGQQSPPTSPEASSKELLRVGKRQRRVESDTKAEEQDSAPALEEEAGAQPRQLKRLRAAQQQSEQEQRQGRPQQQQGWQQQPDPLPQPHQGRRQRGRPRVVENVQQQEAQQAGVGEKPLQQEQQQPTSPQKQPQALINDQQPVQPLQAAARSAKRRPRKVQLDGGGQQLDRSQQPPSGINSSGNSGKGMGSNSTRSLVPSPLQLVASALVLPPRLGVHGKPIASRMRNSVSTGRYIGYLGQAAPQGRRQNRD